ncbi:MAG: MerR family transcriptional regulator [Actinomycetota bacterium]|jgi:DNA-binding transcriptional MerR regulator|nr:MerR family transcriptional regulator [Actinomycetota bacterium]
MQEMGYGGPQATKIVGITYRQLDYWTRTGLVLPSIRSAEGSGTQRVYSFNDLLQLKVIKELIDAGASLQKVRQSIDYVRDNIEGDWSKVTIATDGERVYACTSDAEVLDLLRSGQGVLGSLVSVEKVKEQLDGTLREFPHVAEDRAPASSGHAEQLRAKEG